MILSDTGEYQRNLKTVILLMKIGTYKMDKLLPGIQVVEEDSGKCGSGCYRILFLYSPDLHAHMLCFDDYSHSQRIKTVLNTIPDLGSQPLLHL